MKKLLSLLLILLSSISLTACNKTYKLLKSNIAEIRYNIFAGSSDNFDITFMSGQREKDYVINGYNTDLIDFGIVTIAVKTQDISNNGNFALTIDTLRYEDELEKNPFDGTYVADIGVSITDELNSLSIRVVFGEIVEDIQLNNLSKDWSVDYNDALKLASKTLSSELKPLIKNEFLGEVYVKIIKDTIINDGTYYWYVNFVGRDGITHNIIIDPCSSEILAKK